MYYYLLILDVMYSIFVYVRNNLIVGPLIHIYMEDNSIFFFFWTELEFSLIPSLKANTQPENYKQACRPKVVNRDTESLNTKLGTNLA